ncbi:MAG: phage tail protein [Bacteroidota bacterium]
MRSFNNYVPPVGFIFEVSILGKGGSPGTPADSSFQEVSGISMKLETETIKEGGENRFVHKVPGRASYDDLVLKRGLVVRSSPLFTWCMNTITGGLNKKITPKTIKVSLLDANAKNNHDPLMTWVFENAYPIKWEVSSLDATKSEIVVESISFTYQYFHQEKAAGAKNYPVSDE